MRAIPRLSLLLFEPRQLSSAFALLVQTLRYRGSNRERPLLAQADTTVALRKVRLLREKPTLRAIRLWTGLGHLSGDGQDFNPQPDRYERPATSGCARSL